MIKKYILLIDEKIVLFLLAINIDSGENRWCHLHIPSCADIALIQINEEII